jgi:tetratricopeptide (TPR) repeat protein
MSIKTLKFGIYLLAFSFCTQVSFGQCASWIGLPNQSDAEDAHTIYRQAIKTDDWQIAFENWEIAYQIAPAADGKRDYHFTDGAKIYVQKYKNAQTDADKKLFAEKALALYEEAVSCYQNKSILPSKCPDGSCNDKRIGGVYAKMGYDMYYNLRSPYSKTLAAYNKAIEFGGNDLDYTIFEPILAIVAYQVEKGKMDKETALAQFSKLEAIADYNIENDERFGEYFEQAWKAGKYKLSPVETILFDCEYFKPTYMERYEENPDDPENLKSVIALLKQRDCPDTDPFLVELEAKWKVYAVEINAQRQAEFELNNPAVVAKNAYDEGDYKTAIEKYNEAIDGELDDSKKAGYMFSKASILFRKQSKYGEARQVAYDAAKLRPNWGRPYALIGDMYGKSARSCGDSWNQRLAIIAAIDKYSYAKSIDEEIAEECNRKISTYRKSLPSKDEGFMRGMKEGQSAKVGCWIGETVKIRYQ